MELLRQRFTLAAVRDEARDYTPLVPLLRGEGWLGTPLRFVVAIAGLVLVRAAHQGGVPVGAARSILLYLAFALFYAAALLAAHSWPVVRQLWLSDLGRAFLLGASFVDLVFVSLLVLHSGGPLSDAYLLYFLLLLKIAWLYPGLPEIIAVAAFSGPAYVGMLRRLAGGWFFLVDPIFAWRYLVLLAASLGAAGLGLFLARQQRRLQQAEAAPSAGDGDVAVQTQTLQRTVSDLGQRVQQLRTLQEGVKAINAAMDLEDLLTLIVANASQVVRDVRCSLALLDEDEGAVQIRAVSDLPADQAQAGPLALDQGVAQRVVKSGRPLQVDRVARDRRFARLADSAVGSVISVPLIADGRPIGALSATSPGEGAFSDEDLEILDAFADQAVIAVKTARFYRSVQERRSELEAMLRGIGDAVLATDARLRLTVLNPVAAQIFGVRRDVAAGQRLSEVIDNAELAALFAETLAGDEPFLIREISLPASGADPAVRFYQALASPVLSERDEVRGVVVVLRDITEQKELDRVKSDFLSVVSHELKTPLHSIKGFVDIILMGKTGPVSEHQRDFLETVRQQSEILQNMINDLLEFSRLEAGQTRLRIETVFLGHIVRGVVDRMRPLAQQGNLRLTNQVPVDFGPIEADLARLEQVVTNLVSNAIKFTPAGSITVEAVDLGTSVRVSVADTGIGIATDQVERIFERFYQVDGSATRSYRGTGLGLTICKHIVEYHGGRIWVDSVEGRGSTFHFVLPKRQPAPETLAIDFTVLPPHDA